MASRLPDNPSLERLRADARRLQRGARSQTPEALEFVRRWHPSPDGIIAQHFPLHAGQLAVARRYGFLGWPDLIGYLEAGRALARDPGEVDEAALPAADLFCALACLRYDDLDAPPRWAAAAELLAAQPGLVDTHIWAAAAAADPAAISRHLQRDPSSVSAAGGPHRWSPLLYLAYSRIGCVPGAAPVPAATVAISLLDAGADPDDGFLWRLLATPFTVLTGAFGEGEQGPGRQPRHPASIELARALLVAGADPHDGQTLYNRMFSRDNNHLELLFAFGLGTASEGPWQRRLAAAMPTPAEMLRQQLDWAVGHRMIDRVRLLAHHQVPGAGDALVAMSNDSRPPDLVHGVVDADAVDRAVAAGVDLNALVEGRTPLHQAAWDANLTGLLALLDAGADPDVLDERFGGTALDWAQYAHQQAVVEVLMHRGRRQ